MTADSIPARNNAMNIADDHPAAAAAAAAESTRSPIHEAATEAICLMILIENKVHFYLLF
jgi:hypothetical protein